MHLYADSTPETVWWVALASPILAGLGWIAKWGWDKYIVWRQLNKQDETDREASSLVQYKDLLERMDKERIELREENRKLTEAIRETDVKVARAITWIKHLESVLDTLKVPPYMKWEDEEK